MNDEETNFLAAIEEACIEHNMILGINFDEENFIASEDIRRSDIDEFIESIKDNTV